MINFKEILNSIIRLKIFKSFTTYTGATFINLAIPFFLLPILTRFLLPSDFGILATFMAMIAIVNVIASMGCIDAVIRGYFDREKKGFSFTQFIFNAILVNFIIFLILIVATYFLKSSISAKFSVFSNFLFLLPVIGFCSAIYSIPLKLFIMQQKAIPYAVLTISNTLLEVLFSIFLVVVIGLNWKGRVLAISINSILFLIVGVYILIKIYPLNLTLNFNYIKKILSYGVPVVFHSLGFTIIATVDKIFLIALVGLSATGLYSVGYSIASIIALLVGAFNTAWNPILYEKLGHSTPGLKVKLVKITYLYFFLIISAAILLNVFAPFFLKFFVGKNFYGVSQFIFWISLGYVMFGMYTMVVNYIFYEKKTYLLSIVAVITVVLSIIFNFALIKLNGAIGAAQATFLTFLCRFLLVWYFSNKVYPMPWFSFLKVNR